MAVVSLQIVEPDTAVAVGGTMQLGYLAFDAFGKQTEASSAVGYASEAVWASSAPSVASIERETGFLTGHTDGTTTIILFVAGVRTTKGFTVGTGVSTAPVGAVTIAAPPSTYLAIGSTVDLVVTVLDAASAPLAGRTVAASASPGTGAISYPTGQTSSVTGQVTVRVTGLSDGATTITPTSGGVSGAGLVLDVVPQLTLTYDHDFLDPAQRSVPRTIAGDLLPDAWVASNTQLDASPIYYSHYENYYPASFAESRWGRNYGQTRNHWLPMWDAIDTGGKKNSATWGGVIADSPYEVSLGGTCNQFGFPAFDPAVVSAPWSGNGNYRGPAITNGFSTQGTLDNLTPEPEMECYAAFWVKADDAGNVGKVLHAMLWRGSDVGDLSFRPYYETITRIVLTAGWQRVVLGPYVNLNAGVGGYALYAENSPDRATAFRCTYFTHIMGRPDDAADTEAAFAISEFGHYVGRNSGNQSELGVNIVGYTSNIGGMGRTGGAPAPLATPLRPVTLANTRFDATQTTNAIVGWVAVLIDDKSVVLIEWTGRPSNTARYGWVKVYVEPDTTGWMPSDTDLEWKFNGWAGAPVLSGPLVADPSWLWNGNGGRWYRAQIDLGTTWTAPRTCTLHLRYAGSGVKTANILPPSFELEGYNDARNIGIDPTFIPPINLAGNGVTHANGGFRDTGTSMYALSDATKVVTTDQGLIGFEIVLPYDPYLRHTAAIAAGLPGIHANLSDTGPGGTNFNALVISFESDVDGKLYLRALLDPGIAEGDPNNGNYRAATLCHREIHAGEYPAGGVIRFIPRWQNAAGIDYYLETPGINGGVGAMYDASTNVLLTTDPATPAYPSGLAWDFDSRVLEFYGPTRLPVKLWLGGDRDWTLNLCGWFRRVITAKQAGTHRQLLAFVQTVWGARAVVNPAVP